MRGFLHFRAAFIIPLLCVVAVLLCGWYFSAIVCCRPNVEQTSLGGKMKDQFTRRRFLTTAGAAAGATFLGSALFHPEQAMAFTPLVRRDVTNMTAYDPVLVSYAKAIQAMQALPNTNPLSWAYQAAIHWTTLPGPPQPAWDSCQHGNYFFWSWHRMYLYWFERIVRKMCGDPCWTLPYWPWTTLRSIPAPFRDPASLLYTVNRDPAMNGGALLPVTDVSYASSFSQTNFTTASSIFQGTPHGAVHVDVGGWMSSVPTAAQDPIFYLHHANCDRLWDLWLVQGGGRSDPLGDATWKNTQFTFFNEAGAQVKMTGCDVLRAAEQLNYVYEGEPPQVNEFCLRIFPPPWIFTQEILVKLPIPPVTLGPEPVSFPIEMKELRQKVGALAESQNETLFLELDAEAERAPRAVWEVYVGLPPNSQPNPESPYYVGNLVLFGEGIRDEAHGQFKPAHLIFPINRALAASLKANEANLPVTFVAHGVVVEGRPTRAKVAAPVKIVGAAISVEHAKRGEQPPSR
jgi:hypothetical protein